MKITLGSPEILIVCGTVLGMHGNSIGLVVFATIGCISGVLRFATENQERVKKI